MEAKRKTAEHRDISREKCTESLRIVLVGTNKGNQLIKWRGWYNYPISDDDKITETDAATITELWLFNGTKEQRTYKAEFVGIKTRQELVDDYGYPAKGKAHGDRYLLFRTRFKYLRVHLPKKGEFTAVELFAGAGGLSIGLERAGIHVVIANEIMPDFAATLAANRLEVKVNNEDSFREAE